jgi:hypothetical protein
VALRKAAAELARFRAAQDASPQPVDEHFAAAVEEVKRLEAGTSGRKTSVKQPAKKKPSRHRTPTEDGA